MSGDEICAELTVAKEALARRDLDAVYAAIVRAEKAWAIEVDCWAQELYDAEKEINSR